MTSPPHPTPPGHRCTAPPHTHTHTVWSHTYDPLPSTSTCLSPFHLLDALPTPPAGHAPRPHPTSTHPPPPPSAGLRLLYQPACHHLRHGGHTPMPLPPPHPPSAGLRLLHQPVCHHLRRGGHTPMPPPPSPPPFCWSLPSTSACLSPSPPWWWWTAGVEEGAHPHLAAWPQIPVIQTVSQLCSIWYVGEGGGAPHYSPAR